MKFCILRVVVYVMVTIVSYGLNLNITIGGKCFKRS